MSVSIEILSGLLPKAPAAIILNTGKRRFLLDAGGCIGTTDVPWEVPADIDAVFISHDHQDHIGGVHQLPEHIPIYCSAFISNKLSSRDHVYVLPAHGCTNVMGVQVRTGSNGHSLGGLWFHFDVAGGVFYSGDYCLESETYQFDYPPAANVALLDMSYGNHDIPLAKQKVQLKEVLLNACMQGNVLLPVPASGRSIELALWFNEWLSAPICFDENGFDHIEEALEHDDVGFKPNIKNQLKKFSRSARVIQHDSTIESNEVVLAGSPDLDCGLAKKLTDIENDSVGSIVFTGHMGVRARELCQQGKACFIRWNVHPTLSDTMTLTEHLQCQTLIPLFHPDLSSLQTQQFHCHVHTNTYWESSDVIN